MKYHIALSRPIDVEEIARNAQQQQCPRHAMGVLREVLGATVHAPKDGLLRKRDRLKAKLAGSPQQWTLARQLSQTLTGQDLIFCTGEDIGIPIAACCGSSSDRPKIAVFIHNLDRPRGYLSAKLFDLAHRIDLFITNATAQAEFLEHKLGVPPSRIFLLSEHIDTQFFVPGAADPHKTRPILASVGLENRDYRTIAQATQDLDVDVRISGFSRDARVLARAFPPEMPANMTRQFYPWPELLRLYWDADVVIVSLVENKFCAGLTAMLEAIACGKPTIVTHTSGLTAYLKQFDSLSVVEPGNAEAMQRAILEILRNPSAEYERAKRRREQLLKQNTMEVYIETLVNRLTAVS